MWRFEAVGRNGGIGVDSSEEKLVWRTLLEMESVVTSSRRRGVVLVRRSVVDCRVVVAED